MKYIITLILCILSFNTVAAEGSGVITLCHQGKATILNHDELIYAVSIAEEGDTIMLSDGTFVATVLELRKYICFIGAGSNNTTIKGDAYLYPPLKNATFTGINITNFWANNKSENLIIKDCKINNVWCGYAKNVLIENSSVSFGSESNIDSITIRNSEIYIRNSKIWENAKIINCNVSSNSSLDSVKGDFINCIIWNVGKGYNNTDVKFTNVLYSSNDTDFNNDTDLSLCSKVNCWYVPHTNVCNLSKEELSEKKYLGTDGTIVGRFGGNYESISKTEMPIVSHTRTFRNTTNKTIEFDLSITSK